MISLSLSLSLSLSFSFSVDLSGWVGRCCRRRLLRPLLELLGRRGRKRQKRNKSSGLRHILTRDDCCLLSPKKEYIYIYIYIKRRRRKKRKDREEEEGKEEEEKREKKRKTERQRGRKFGFLWTFGHISLCWIACHNNDTLPSHFLVFIHPPTRWVAVKHLFFFPSFFLLFLYIYIYIYLILFVSLVFFCLFSVHSRRSPPPSIWSWMHCLISMTTQYVWNFTAAFGSCIVPYAMTKEKRFP